MSAVIVTAAVAPLLSTPSIRAEQVSQLVFGEAAEVLATEGAMYRVRSLIDGYQGWLARGYAEEAAQADAEAWLAGAGWCDGASIRTSDGVIRHLSVRARLRRVGDGVVLPDGASAAIEHGTVSSWPELISKNADVSPATLARDVFSGTPYLWGGVTPFGVDCSGLVQTTWMARGMTLPRDAHEQAGVGRVVTFDERCDGDLLFFRGAESDRITHVAIVEEGDLVVHSALARGGVVRESIDASGLLPRLVAVRRID